MGGLNSLPLMSPSAAAQSASMWNPVLSAGGFSPMSFLGSMFGSGGIGFGGSSSNMSQNTNTSQSGTSTTTRNLTPYQSALQSPLSNLLGNMMGNPMQYLQPYETAAINQNNSTYSGLSNMLAQQFLQTGGGSSGKYGTALAQGDIARLSGNANIASNFQQQAASLPLTAAGLANSFLGQNFGQTSTSSSSGNQATTGSSSTSSFHI